MTKVLEKVPGDNLRQKAKELGVSRQSLYDWQSGKLRPRWPQAEKLAEVTGYKVHEIAGVPEE
jgi:DNA-binding XRE family transcriptional regulator